MNIKEVERMLWGFGGVDNTDAKFEVILTTNILSYNSAVEDTCFGKKVLSLLNEKRIKEVYALVDTTGEMGPKGIYYMIICPDKSLFQKEIKNDTTLDKAEIKWSNLFSMRAEFDIDKSNGELIIELEAE